MRHLTCVFVVSFVLLGPLSEAAAQNCAPRWSLNCNESDHWRNDDLDATDEIVEYSCPSSLSDYTASEYTYTFVSPGDGDVTVTLSGLADDLDLFILEDFDGECDPINCLDFSDNAGTGDEAVTFSATAGTTYYFVIDGFGEDRSDFDIDVECDFEVPCTPAWELSCGDSDAWDTTRYGSTDVVDSYSCVSWNESGREFVYSFTAPAEGTATVSLTDIESGVDLDIFVLDATSGECDPASCLDFGGTTTTFDVRTGHTYYLSVDGYFGAEGSYTIDLSCDLEDRCSPADELTCGETVSWNNDGTGSTNSVFGYGCSTTCGSWTESGPEYAYSFVAPVDGEYSATLSGLTEDLDVFVLDGSEGDVCNPDACVTCNNLSASWTGTAGTTYYVVVDGFDGAVSDYDLSISCPELDVCIPADDVSCGSFVLGSTLDEDATDYIDNYSCSTWTENGPEMAYSFSPRLTSDVTASIHSLTSDQDLDVFIVEDVDGVCDPDECIDSGGVSATFHAIEGQTYYVIVDGFFGDAGDFSLEMECDFGCAPRLALGCGDMEIGNNGGDGSTDRIDTYSCGGWDESGPEYAYSFEASSGGNVTATISDMSADLDIFVIEDAGGDCLQESCLTFGDDEVTFDAVAGRTYYLVVDGFMGATDDYIIELTCSPPPCDSDRDGYDAEGGSCGGDDCDDTNSEINPGAEDVCGDGIDQDCSGDDELCPDCTDDDGDGWGVGATCPAEQDCDDTSADIYPTAEERCGDGIDQDCDGEDLLCPCADRDGDGFSAGDGCTPPVDCDDDDDRVYPGAPEQCGDGEDQDCDGADESCPECEDRDGDNYGVGDGCLGPDCDDYDADINPDAEEICDNGVDDNCADGIDEGCENCTDEDGDRYGLGTGCLGPDCNDSDAEINPDGREICGDGIDQDCDGADAECPCDDNDGDGHFPEDCEGDDCNDDSAAVYPGAPEVCGDGIDQDCDGEDLTCDCEDADNDGYGDRACGGEDCDDADPNINPDVDDPCGDGIDQDCDGADDCPCFDGDRDDFGVGNCGQEEDCDDSDSSVYPGAEEVCGDGIDQDCDGRDQCCMCSDDDDADGHISVGCCSGDDCDDNNDEAHPGADELCENGVDDDCDGEVDEDDCVGTAESTGCNCAVNGNNHSEGLAQLLAILGFLGLTRIIRRR